MRVPPCWFYRGRFFNHSKRTRQGEKRDRERCKGYNDEDVGRGRWGRGNKKEKKPRRTEAGRTRAGDVLASTVRPGDAADALSSAANFGSKSEFQCLG